MEDEDAMDGLSCCATAGNSPDGNEEWVGVGHLLRCGEWPDSRRTAPSANDKARERGRSVRLNQRHGT